MKTCCAALLVWLATSWLAAAATVPPGLWPGWDPGPAALPATEEAAMDTVHHLFRA